ncbi:hypothetical protein DXG01_005589 [Tephrocybe rancida]|nr:hypothetical protein DXG01_005589 [Tephrocybe rancida]
MWSCWDLRGSYEGTVDLGSQLLVIDVDLRRAEDVLALSIAIRDRNHDNQRGRDAARIKSDVDLFVAGEYVHSHELYSWLMRKNFLDYEEIVQTILGLAVLLQLGEPHEQFTSVDIHIMFEMNGYNKDSEEEGYVAFGEDIQKIEMSLGIHAHPG